MAAVKVSIPNINVPLTDGKNISSEWYRFQETLFKRTGGVNGDRTASTEVRVTALEDGKADKTLTITTGNGFASPGPHDLSASFTIAASQNIGWTTSTGTANKGAYATYAGQTHTASYVQATVQALDDAVKAATQRIKALEDALRANGGIN